MAQAKCDAHSTLIVGSKGSGKTLLAKRLVRESSCITVVTSRPHEWEDVPNARVVRSGIVAMLDELINQTPTVAEHATAPSHAVVLDEIDWATENVQKSIGFQMLMMQGRHYTVRLVIIHRPWSTFEVNAGDPKVQSCVSRKAQLPCFTPMTRCNFDQVLLTSLCKQSDLDKIIRDHCECEHWPRSSIDDLNALMITVNQDDSTALLIHKNSVNPVRCLDTNTCSIGHVA